MALVLKDRVRETTTTTGTGNYVLAGAVTGYESFAGIGDGNTTYYACTNGTDWEVGIGTYTASGTILARTTILESSNSDSAVNWAAGSKTIFVTQPSEKAVYLDASGNSNIASSNLTDGSSLLKNVVEDTTPQLGGNLDLNSQNITGTGGINITGTVTATDAVLNGTGAIKVPVGTTAQRPTPAQGQIRYNTTDSSFEGYDGSAWGAIGGGAENSFTVFEYTATASQTTFSGADDNAATLAYTAGNIQVMLNGAVLDPSDFTATNGTSVVLASGAALNDVLNIYAFTSFSVADTVSASTGGTFSANVAVTGDLTVDTNTLYVDSTNNRVGIGTTSPIQTLSVSAPSALVDITSTTGTSFNGLELKNSSGSFYIGQDNSTGSFYGAANARVLYSSGAYPIAFFTNGSNERLRIDSSGRVGIGTTSPAVTLHSHLASSGISGIGANATALFENSGNSDIVIAAGATSSSRIAFGDSGDWIAGRIDYNHSDNSMRFGTNTVAENLRIDSSGTVYFKDGGSSNPAIRFLNDTDTGIFRPSANAIAFTNGGSEKARIDSSGNVLIGTTSYAAGQEAKMIQPGQMFSSRNTTVSAGHISFQNPNGSVGQIFTNGSSTTYNTTSDYRLKENVTADWDATTRLKQLNPVRFNFIADPDTTVDGFLAHEVQDIVPEAITGTKDEVDDDGNAVMQGIDQSKLVPLLVKTIQELEARIAALENA